MNIIIINKIISFLWNDKLISYKWKLSLSLVSKQFFQLISRNYFTTVLPYTLQADIESHIESPFCLLKYVRYLELDFWHTRPFEYCEKYSTFYLSNTESLVLRLCHHSEPLIKLNKFLKSFSSILTNLKELSINDIPSTDGNEVIKILTEDHLSTFTNHLESLILLCNSRVGFLKKNYCRSPQISAIADGKFNNLKNLTLTGCCDDILYTPNIIKNLTTIKLGIPLVSYNSPHSENHMLEYPDQFFNLLSENKVIERLDLFLCNQTDFIDYKSSFFKYLERNQTLTSLSLGFIRDIKYLEIIKSKINIKHLRITMNEPIVFNQLESLHLSSRNDRLMYHQLIALRKSYNNNANEFKLKKLSLKFCIECEILCHLSLIIKDLETIRSLSIEYPPMILVGEINRLVHTKNIKELHILSRWYSDESTLKFLIDEIKQISANKSICFEQTDNEYFYIEKTSAVRLTQAVHNFNNTVLYYQTKSEEEEEEEEEVEIEFWNGKYVFDQTGLEDYNDYND